MRWLPSFIANILVVAVVCAGCQPYPPPQALPTSQYRWWKPDWTTSVWSQWKRPWSVLISKEFSVDSTEDAPDEVPGNGKCETGLIGTGTSQSRKCTLRAAIEETNALVGRDKINVPAGVYRLSLGELTIRDSVIIAGAGLASSVIDGDGKSRVLNIDFRQVLVCDSDKDTVLRYNINGEFIGPFVPSQSGGLNMPTAIASQSESLFIAGGPGAIYRYNSETGAPQGYFIPPGTGGLSWASDLAFSGTHLYTTNYVIAGGLSGGVLRYDAATGAFIDEFIPAGRGGLSSPNSLLFQGGDLFVSSAGSNEVLRFDRSSGALKGSISDWRLKTPRGLAARSSTLYVASWGSNEILAYDAQTGVFQGSFITAGSGGLSKPAEIAFGPDGYLYVRSAGTKQILRYHPSTGAFLDVFIDTGAGGLAFPSCIHFIPGIGSGPKVSMSGVTIQNGKGGSFVNGGGVSVSRGSALTVTDSLITQNESYQLGGGISNGGYVELIRTTISNNKTSLSGGGGQMESGGGIYNSSSGQVVLRGSTISGNEATRGGGIRNWGGSLTITNTTISGNKADTQGGGIMNFGTAEIRFSTISQNEGNRLLGGSSEPSLGGGIIHLGGGTLSMAGTILDGNTDNRTRFSADFGPDCFAKSPNTLTSHRNNLVGVLNQNCEIRDTIYGDTRFDLVGTADSNTNSPLDALLQPLGNYGGQTATHSLGNASPAIDGMLFSPEASAFDCPTLDQRGSPRPVDGNADGTSVCDIGATER